MKTITFNVGEITLQVPDGIDKVDILKIKNNMDNLVDPCSGFHRELCKNIIDCDECVLENSFTAKLWIKEMEAKQ